ncbi:MAG: hypothetical protein VX278_09360, partial [Myxococcota bacterium]|nr:hypothetical protein [Myxococcota bacterium]
LLIPYGLERLLSLLYIHETTDIKSAAVPLGPSPRLLINPDFVQQYCQKDEDLAALILHELHHVLLGHTRLFKRVTPLHNIAFDAVINAMISRQEPRYRSFFMKMYRADSLPEAILRPPIGFPYSPQYPDVLPQTIRDLIHDLYYTNLTTFLDVFQRLISNSTLVQMIAPPFLLGEHGEDVRGYSYADNPELFAAIREIVEEWPQPKDPKIGRSLDEILKTEQVSIQKTNKPERTILSAIRKAAQNGEHQFLSDQRRRHRPIQQSWPSRDRRAWCYSAAGGTPLLYSSTIPMDAGIQKIDLYLDVSGSMTPFISNVISAVLSCKDWLKTNILLFSTTLNPCSIKQLQEGRYQTTNGTDIAVVSEDIERKKSKSAVILSDGYVGEIPANHLRACQRCNIQFILTPNGYTADVQNITNHFHYLGEAQ